MEKSILPPTSLRPGRAAWPGRPLLWLLALLLSLAGAAQAQVTTLSYTGAPQTYVVPAGITQLKVVAQGGSGGSNGAVVTAIVTVTPGETLTAVVGGEGIYDQTGSAGGYNGGTKGDDLDFANENYGGGGGGATDLRRAIGNGSTGDYLTSRNALVVAGGAGGGGYNENGGDGGTPNNADAPNGGGGGGTASGPGAGVGTGTSGVNNVGGAAEVGSYSGGGGGGYYGGGGGGGGAGIGLGGGGGSSFVTATGSSGTSYALATTFGNGSITLSPVVPGLTVTAVNPTSGVRGSSVTITGTGFTGATGVSFGRWAASSFVVNSSTQITAVVANATFTGPQVVSVTNASGTNSGTVTFTVVLPASVGTSNPVVTGTTVSLGGTVNNENGNTVTERGVVYSTTSNPPTTADTKVVINSGASAGGTGSFSQAVSGFPLSTTYYVRAYAISSVGTSYGAVRQFTTGSGSTPTITSITPTSGPVGTSVAITGTGFLLGGNNVRFNGVLITSGSTNSTTSITAVVPNGATTGNVTVQNSNGTSNGVPFTVLSAPSVTTNAATSVAYNRATLNGNVTSDGGFAVTERGFVYSTTIVAPDISNGTQVVVGSGTGAFSQAITGLNYNTTYFLRAYAINSLGTTYGSDIAFTTPGLPANFPTISSLSPSSGQVGESVTIGGTNFVSGSTSVTFNGTAATSVTVNSASSLTVLVPAGASTGFIRVTTPVGTTMQNPNFTVFAPATVTTAAVTGIGNLSATMGGNVTADNGSTVSERGVVYSSINPTPNIYDVKVAIGSGTGAFSQAITGLTTYTVYYVRAYAFNGAGTSYGAVVQFRTDPTAPTLTSLSPTSGPTGTSVTLTGADFLSGSTVSFGGTAAASVTVNSLTSITAVVPGSLPVGSVNVSVTTAGGTTTSRAFDVKATPTVTTNAATNLTTTSATLGGNVTADGGLAVTEYGVVYSTSNATPTTADTKLPLGSGTGSFSQTQTGLMPSTTYYVRAYATNSLGTSYGAVQQFSTQGRPIVTTDAPIGITPTGVTFVGNLISEGGQQTEIGFVYVQGTSTPDITDVSHTRLVANGGLGRFTFTVINRLTPNTQYTVRAYARNGNGTSYGVSQTFFTTTDPTVTTAAPTNITRYAATLGGNVTFDGNTTVTDRGVVYSTSNATPTTADTKLPLGSGTGSFSQTLTNLTNGTTYYVRAYATNAVSTTYGAVQQFTAQDAAVYWPLALTGFNADVVMRNISNSPANETTASVDGGSPGYVFYERGYQGTTSPNGLPTDGRFTSAVTSGLPYQLQPYNISFAGNNSLRLAPGASGTLTLAPNYVVVKKLYVLATSGGGASTISVTMNFNNGAPQTVTGLAVPDWFNGANAALSGFGRLLRSTTTGQSVDNSNAGNPRLYEIPVTLPIQAYEDLALLQIDITNDASSGGVVNVMAITAELTPTTLSAGTTTITNVVQLFTLPPGTTVQAQGWGGGGGGSGGGGGGAAYATTTLPGNNNYVVDPGANGPNNFNGTASVVTTGAGTTVLRAQPGLASSTGSQGGLGGTAAASFPTAGAVSGTNGTDRPGNSGGAGGAAGGPGGGAGGVAGSPGVGGGAGAA
ncbi:IPT/TIG domain-containing protein, partial [Hymenobacter sp. ASUV-10]